MSHNDFPKMNHGYYVSSYLILLYSKQQNGQP